MECLTDLPQTKDEFIKLVPSLVRLLRNFLSMGYSPEHDVSGITDPFMQVKILRLLRYLGKHNEEASEQMNDVLAQVATNTETTKNAGNAILYECVSTIMDVESDSSLRVLAVNILGRFLLNRDNNIRYVALNSLTKVVSEDIGAVQRHRNTIVDCLKDPDISIRQRALDLIYQLVNESNVINLTTELLNYLIVAQSEHKVSLASKIIQIVEKYSPSKKWRVDTIITMLTIAGNITDESVPRTAIIFIAQAEGLHAYATHRLYRALVEDSTMFGLSQVAIWCIGEYGGSLLQSCNVPTDNENNGNSSSNGNYSPVSENEIISLLEKCSKQHNADASIKGLVINALMKLSVRFNSPSSKSLISDIIAPYCHSMSLELQQRSCEYTMLLGNQWDHLRKDLLDKMPILDESEVRKRRAAFEEGTFQDDIKSGRSQNISPLPPPSTSNTMDMFGGNGNLPKPSSSSSSSGPSLLDLDDIFGGGSSTTTHHQPMANNILPTSNNPPLQQSTHDLLGQIFSSPSSSTMPIMPTNNAMGMYGNSPMSNNLLQPQPPMMTSPPMNNSPYGMNSMGAALPPAAPAPLSPAPQMAMPMIATNLAHNLNINAFDKNGLTITMDVSKSVPNDLSVTKLICKFSNATAIPFENFVFQVRT
jgi:AP-1 complex subunit gamma-1